MIKIENVEIAGWEPAIRVLHSSNNSLEKSDSGTKYYFDECERKVIYRYTLGPNDKKLMMNLRYNRADYHEFTQMITVYLDITAPSYWWKEFDACRICTVANPYSMIHQIIGKEFTLEDFSRERLVSGWTGKNVNNEFIILPGPCECLENTIAVLNRLRKSYIDSLNKTSDTGLSSKDIWWQLIHLLPSAYNQKRIIMISYESLANIYKNEHNHKLDEWCEFYKWVKSLPYSELITGEEKDNGYTK